MPIALLTSKGQMTIPKEVRRALNLKPSEKMVIVVEGDQGDGDALSLEDLFIELVEGQPC